MNYKIQAVETIELKRSIGTVDFERIEEPDMGKPASFAEIANMYDGGKIKFLQDWAKAIDDVDTSIYKINNYLASKVGCAIAEGLVLNDAKAGDVHENCSSVDDFYDNYGEYVKYGCNRERFHYAVGYLERSIEHGVWMIIDKELHDLYGGHVISTNCSIQIGDKLQTDRLGSVIVDITTNIDVEVDCPDSTKIDLHLLRNELEAELGATIDLDGEGLVPVTWGLELTSVDKN